MDLIRQKINTFLFSSIILLLTAGCAQFQGIDNIPTAHGSASFNIYESFGELAMGATEIVEVKVSTKQETFVDNDLPFTVSNVKIKSVLKGALKENDTIPVVEVGGIYQPLINGDPKRGKQKQYVNYIMEGNKVMQSGEEYILFLNPIEGGTIKNSYYPIGLYQGKYKVHNGGKVARQNEKEFSSEFMFNSVDELKEVISRVKQQRNP
ncbi:hypothetical protein [Xylanibacillus composti]|uniref:hypothetical protein n=1 Tax=Xylanibacillus composti TaxID=1572762 RepID=UPI0028F6F74F|nr:hypothetical protein [Xylanibacillus composti]